MNATVIYYTSNREEPAFEQRIVGDLMEKANHPIIAVSQRAMPEFSDNIVVGDVGLSYPNEYRQILLGAKAAETEWIITAESDFVYPEEYFAWEPPNTKASLFWYDPIWVVWDDPTRRAFRKGNSEGAMYVRRDFLIEHVAEYLEPFPDWTTTYHGGLVWKRHARVRTVHGKTPALTFKTGRGVNWHCGVLAGMENRSAKEVPGWGSLDELRRRWLGS